MTGFLIPESILFSLTFKVLLIFVGINTLIYLGLTAGRLIPWPKPVQTHRLKALRGAPETKEVEVEQHAPGLRHLSDPASRLKLETAYQTIPVALTLTGVTVLVLTLVRVLSAAQTSLLSDIVGAVFALAVIAMAQFAGRRLIPPRLLPWAWSVSMATIVAFVAWQAAEEDNAVTLAYGLVVVVALTPISLSWAAGALGSLASFTCVVAGGYFVNSVQTVGWAMAVSTALATGAVLLQLRFISLDRIAAEQARIATMLTTDPLTGALSRRGLADLAPSAWNAARISKMPVYGVMVTVDDLIAINSNYGIAYGDEVLLAAYRAVRNSLPEGALVARWAAGAYAAVGVGALEPATLPALIRQALDDSGVGLGKPTIHLTVREAHADPDALVADALVAEASGRTPIRV